MSDYVKPSVNEVGTLHDLTLSTINKTAGSGDVIMIGSESVGVPGGVVVSVS
jgi:hypothetical protein